MQRAAKTASKIREAQLARPSDDGLPRTAPNVVKLPLLVEQDFGSMEGKKWYDRPSESKVSEGERVGLQGKDAMDFVDVESRKAMAKRADAFLDKHFLPLLDDALPLVNSVVAIVSHGIFLSTLWKRLLLRLPPKSVALSPELQVTARPSLEHLGGWANTGYLELHLEKPLREDPDATTKAHPASLPEPSSLPDTGSGIGKVDLPPLTATDNTAAETSIPETESSKATRVPRLSTSRLTNEWMTTVLTINGKDHLKGLKRTGGGVGSSRHDTSQKSIDTFFKRRRVE